MQKYFKKENKKVDKTDLIEITGDRTELEPFVGQVLDCDVFLTNSTGYLGDKRLITEVRIPKTPYFIRHLWVKSINCPVETVPHGYQKIKLKVITYNDQTNGHTKYGVKIADDSIKAKRDPNANKMVIPKWKLEQLENDKMKAKPRAKSPFKKIKIIKKG